MIKPMLCFSSEPFDDEEWIFQLKLDGTRTICYVNHEVKLINRRMVDFTYRYPEITKAVKEGFKGKRGILDGEIVVFNEEGLPDFSKLQTREHVGNKFRIELLSKQMPATYVLFDIISLNGGDLSQKPLMERIKILKENVKEAPHLMILDYVDTYGKKFFEEVRKLGIEGIVAKKKDSPYVQKRSKFWLKIKALKTIDCVILGYTPGKGKRKGLFGALLLGAYDGKRLHYLGRVGTGWSREDMEKLKKEMDKLRTKRYEVEKYDEHLEVIWIKPELVCEVKYLEMKDKLRAPSFVRLRYDKPPRECTLKEVEQ
ncbi:MAG: non-homologous end-joining DNA ligase [Nanoarchaeota archaeon]|nr:non-homologous end-joining DNA ligase [Nanoarchaeota archaeon]